MQKKITQIEQEIKVRELVLTMLNDLNKFFTDYPQRILLGNVIENYRQEFSKSEINITHKRILSSIGIDRYDMNDLLLKIHIKILDEFDEKGIF
jgi:hypothetical protein